MFGFNAFSIDTIFHPERAKVKWFQGSDEKKGNTVEKTFLYYKKNYLKLLIYNLPVCVKDDSGPWEKKLRISAR